MKFYLFPRLLGSNNIHTKPKKRLSPWNTMFDDILPLCFLDFSLRPRAAAKNVGGDSE